MAALTDYVTLGRSGLRVSPLCLGAMTFGTEWGIGVEPPASFDLLDAYIDAGGNFIDTANIYNKGHSEVILGDWYADRGNRDRLVIATKWLGNMFRGDPNGGGAHRKSLASALDDSLRRLRTDYVDLLWMHFWDRHTPIDETMRALDDLVRSGKVRYVGFSDTPAWKCAQAQTIADFRGWTPLCALQIEYSLMERTVEGELVPMARELGMGVTPWSPLKGGLLTGKYRREHRDDASGVDGKRDWLVNSLTDRNLAIIDALVSVGEQLGVSPAAVALAWVQNRSGVESTIIGARTLDQLDKNLDALEVELPADAVQALDEVSEPPPHFPTRFLKNLPDNIQGGTTVNGRPSTAWHMAPQSDDERY